MICKDIWHKYHEGYFEIVIRKKISPGTEDVSDSAFVTVAGKYGVDKATNQKEIDII